MKTSKQILGILAILLLVYAIFEIKNFPGGMFFPGFLFRGILLVVFFLIILFISYILKLIFKKYTTFEFFLPITVLSLIAFNYCFYSPNLKIIVPVNYTGIISLVLSNSTNNILKIDENGIGYINEFTFERTYQKPTVFDTKGKELTSQIKGFNNLIFWSRNETCCVSGKLVNSIDFEILPPNKTQKIYKFRDFVNSLNLKITKLIPPNEYQKDGNTEVIIK